ncbi:DnaJ domain-containing protein [Pseudoclavibacter chungangensis]|uniref:DnaJ domain-containing protein n=1 Tax=Pseudoclavibacter chungangensis TaxID=587635 RepID=A0A7J5C1E3_9MICO|nr:DnaJ C-terminal domain-containing protein [Pseudoclavibacter chungangensis]KAB1662447.1 DnaJ domain-containing protein [Pseudoclavibacter chungangensis]NYJ68478.1 molecular chaperone DnaJ [Pseudoclavibacter chungangensis]
MASQDWFDKDFYAVLDVPKDVSEQDLKKRYRKLAREFHPDSHPGDPAAEERFKEISEAYSVLSDPAERAEYDQLRAMGSGARFTPGGQGGGGGFEDVFGGMFNQGGGRQQQQYSNADFEDLLGSMFGGGGGGGFGAGSFRQPQQPRGPQKGRDQTASTTLGFGTAFRGDTVTLQTGEGKTITVRIPAGVEDGQKIRLKGKGAPSTSGGPNGDLILQVAVRPDPVFGRQGRNVTVDVPITFPEAALGATIEVPTVDGDPIRVKVPKGTSSGKTLRVKGRGFSGKSGTGDLLVKLQVAVPSHLNDEQEKALDAFVAASGHESPREDLLRRARQTA